MFPVIWYFLFGSWFKSQLGSLVSAAKGLYLDIFGIGKIAMVEINIFQFGIGCQCLWYPSAVE
jgi:hypothetical protein